MQLPLPQAEPSQGFSCEHPPVFMRPFQLAVPPASFRLRRSRTQSIHPTGAAKRDDGRRRKTYRGRQSRTSGFGRSPSLDGARSVSLSFVSSFTSRLIFEVTVRRRARLRIPTSTDLTSCFYFVCLFVHKSPPRTNSIRTVSRPRQKVR